MKQGLSGRGGGDDAFHPVHEARDAGPRAKGASALARIAGFPVYACYRLLDFSGCWMIEDSSEYRWKPLQVFGVSVGNENNGRVTGQGGGRRPGARFPDEIPFSHFSAGQAAMSLLWGHTIGNRRFLYPAIVCASVPALGAAGADPIGPLQGEYRFHGKTLVDSAPNEPGGTHLGLTLEGPSARALFERMEASAERDLCLDDGSRTKVRGPLTCTELANGEGWRCEVGIDLVTPTLVAEVVC